MPLQKVFPVCCRSSVGLSPDFGIWQGKVATAGIHMVAKRPDGMGKGIIMALMVEMFAILGFITSILMLGKV